MKEYKLVCLNEKLKLSRKKDLAQAENTLNRYIADGWVLEQVVAQVDLFASLVAVLYKEKTE